VGIYIYDEVEVLDFAGPYEVFSTAARVYQRQNRDRPKLFDVITIAEQKGMIKVRGGLLVQPGFDIAQHPPLDVLIVPGGVVTAELQRETVIGWIAGMAAPARMTASVCTGAFLLAKTGLLNGKQATTHWEDIDDLRAMFPDLDVQEGTRWVDNGKIITSAGISAGIDMSLHLLARLESESLAIKTARQMEFDWHSG